MPSADRELERLRAALGLKPLNKFWAKLEIALGLLAAGGGLLLGTGALARPGEVDATCAGAGLALFALGGYLALAGHRSHLYQSNNLLAAYLAELIRSENDKGSTS